MPCRAAVDLVYFHQAFFFSGTAGAGGERGANQRPLHARSIIPKTDCIHTLTHK